MTDGYEELFLCKPCAEEMKTDKYKTVEDVKYIQSVTKKGTCEQCRCRRFGYRCNVKFKAPEALKEGANSEQNS